MRPVRKHECTSRYARVYKIYLIDNNKERESKTTKTELTQAKVIQFSKGVVQGVFTIYSYHSADSKRC